MTARQATAVLAGLIVLAEDWPAATVAGVSWPEFRMREAVTAGARHIVVCAERLPRGLVEAIDRLRGEGVAVSLVRTPADAASVFHPDEIVLLAAGHAVIDGDVLSALLTVDGHAVLTIAAGDATDAFERIDADDRWTGFARIDGAMVRDTARAAGDWDLAAMLLRQALRGRAVRMRCDPARLVDDPGTATRRRLMAPAGAEYGLQRVLRPVVRLIAQAFSRHLPLIVRAAPALLGIIAILAIVAAILTMPVAAFAVLVGLELALAISLVAAAATAIPLRRARGVDDLAPSMFAVVVVIVLRSEATLAALAAVPLVAMALTDRADTARPRWQPDRAAYATVLLIAAIWRPLAVEIAAIAVTGWSLAALWVAQNRLSRVLTPHD